MEQPVKDRVSERRIPHSLMPVLNRELTGDDGCAAPVSILQEFESVASVLIIEGGKPPIIEHQSGMFGQGGHEFRISSIALGHREFLEEARQPQIQNGIPFATGLVAQGTCEPGVADAGGAGDEHIVALVDPLARDQAQQEGFIEPTRVTIVDLLSAGTQPQRGLAHTRGEPAVTSDRHLAIDEQPQACFEAARLTLRSVHLLAERCGHAREFQGQPCCRASDGSAGGISWVRVVIRRATAMAMGDHRGGSGWTRQGLLVERVCEDRLETRVRTGADADGASAGGFEALRAIALAESHEAQTRTEALLGMRP